MIDEFSWQLSLYSERQGSSTIYQEDLHKESNVTPDTTPRSVTPSSLQDDIMVLTEIYGELYPGKVIELPLDYACTLLGRTRHRVDAFARLQNYLWNKYQTELKITSRKTH